MIININNIEKNIFQKKEIFNNIPRLKHLHDQYIMSIRLPALAHLGKQAMMDFFDQVKEDDLEIIENILKDKVVFKKTSNLIVKNIELDKNNIDFTKFDNNFTDFTLSSNGERVFITFWS